MGEGRLADHIVALTQGSGLLRKMDRQSVDADFTMENSRQFASQFNRNRYVFLTARGMVLSARQASTLDNRNTGTHLDTNVFSVFYLRYQISIHKQPIGLLETNRNNLH